MKTKEMAGRLCESTLRYVVGYLCKQIIRLNKTMKIYSWALCRGYDSSNIMLVWMMSLPVLNKDLAQTTYYKSDCMRSNLSVIHTL